MYSTTNSWKHVEGKESTVRYKYERIQLSEVGMDFKRIPPRHPVIHCHGYLYTLDRVHVA